MAPSDQRMTQNHRASDGPKRLERARRRGLSAAVLVGAILAIAGGLTYAVMTWGSSDSEAVASSDSQSGSRATIAPLAIEPSPREADLAPEADLPTGVPSEPSEEEPSVGADVSAPAESPSVDDRRREARRIIARRLGLPRAPLVREPGASGQGEREGATPDPQAERVDEGSPAPESAVGSFEPAVVTRLIRARIRMIQACYERELAADPTLTGRVLLRFTIRPDGSVFGTTAQENTTGNPAVAACIVNVVRQLRFSPGPEGGNVSFAYPFVFEPS